MTKRTPTTQMNNLSFPSLSREELENLLAHLYEMFENVRNFIDLRMIGQSDPLVKKFKKIIKNRLIGDIEDGINILPGGQNPPEKIIHQETRLAETNKKSQTTEENEMKADHPASFICVFISYIL